MRDQVCALVALLALTLASPLGAQAAGARVTGTAVDAATGRPLPDVEVRLAGADTTVARTDARGAWSAAVAPGRYTIRARRVGYSAAGSRLDVAGDVRAPILALDEVPLALEQVVVTAARREQRLADAVTTTEVLTRADIERTGASDLASVLVEQTGIQVQGGHPAGEGVMLQGIGSERVLVLLDGQPVVGRISGVFDVSRIPTSVVERVEVVKGPQSTLYGTDAMGGVVNIVTRTPARGALGASATLTAGSHARRDGAASVTLGRGAFSSRWDVGRRHTETTPGIASETGALASRTDAAVKLRWAPVGDSVTLEAAVLALDERQRWRSGTFYNFGDNVQWGARLGGEWRRGAHRLAPTFYGSLYDHLSRASTEPRPFADDDGSRQRQRVWQGELLYTGRLGAHALDAGAQVRRDETETERVPGGLRTVTSVEPFVQLDIVATSRLAVVPGARVTRSSQWGTRLTPRVAARWRPAFGGERLVLRASAGEGFRAPDFKELFMFFENSSAGYAVLGNPDLRPEHSRNLTAGAEWAGERAYLRGQLFLNHFRDFIETRPVTQPGEAPVFRYGNVDDGSTRGVELESGITLRGLRVETSYAGLATRDDVTGRSLLARPSHSGRAVVSAPLPFAIRTSLAAVYTGRTPMQRDETTGTVTSWRDAFLRTDVRVARTIGGPRGLEIVAGADNLFDTRPAEWAGYTGRHVYTALSWTISRTDDQ